MVATFSKPYAYNRQLLENWKSSAIGVYYIGAKVPGRDSIYPYYIGKGCSVDGGMKCRLLDHLGRWSDATHFQIRFCDTEAEATALEAAEIKKYRPKYNKVGL